VESGDLMLGWLDPGRMIGASLLAGVFLVIGIILSAILRRLIAEALRHDRSERIDQITLSFLSHLTILILWLLLIGFYGHLLPALNRLGNALLAGVSLVSIIVGFAAQSTLGNLVAGISLVLYKPFRRGDRIQIQAPTGENYEVGVVEDISLGYTVLRTDDQRQIIVANGTMAQQTMIKLPPSTAPVSPKPGGRHV
jgi:small-conductance mechanosensitive channel